MIKMAKHPSKTLIASNKPALVYTISYIRIVKKETRIAAKETAPKTKKSLFTVKLSRNADKSNAAKAEKISNNTNIRVL